MNPSDSECLEAKAEADRILAATIYLMSCHARNQCPRLACMIAAHLRALGRHAEAGLHVRHTCQRLAAAWEAIRQHDEQGSARAVATGILH